MKPIGRRYKIVLKLLLTLSLLSLVSCFIFKNVFYIFLYIHVITTFLAGGIFGYRRYWQLMNDQHLHYKQLEALLSLYWDVNPQFGLPSLRGYAASPDFLKLLSETITSIRPNNILECGSGTSTLVTAYMLRNIGSGKVYSLDHDPFYADQTRMLIKKHGLEDFAQIINAPLKPVIINDFEYMWYDVNLTLIPPDVGLIIVDGPPQHYHNQIRYPVIPLTYHLYNKNAVILVDDYNRQAEKKMVASWLVEYPFLRAENLYTEKGTCKLIIT